MIVGMSLSNSQADTEDVVIHQVNHPPTCTSMHLPFTGGFESIFAAGLLISHGTYR